jgi:hypothetical protein
LSRRAPDETLAAVDLNLFSLELGRQNIFEKL